MREHTRVVKIVSFLFVISSFFFLRLAADTLKIPRDTAKAGIDQTTVKFEKYNIAPDTQMFKLHGEIPLEEILQKKAYTKGVAAGEIGGEKKEQIALQKVNIERKVEKPVTLLKELPEKLQTQIKKEKAANEQVEEIGKIDLNKIGSPKPAEIITEPTVSSPVNLAANGIPIKTSAIATLGETKEQSAIPILRETIAKSPVLKHEAATALAKIGDTIGVQILKAELKSEELPVKIKAIESFGEIKETSVIPQLRALLNQEGTTVATEVAFSLAKNGDPKGTDKVKEMLKSNDEELRLRAATTLAELKDKSAIPVLEAFLQAPKSITKAQAATALGEIGDQSVIPVLENIMKTAYDFRVRLAASESILKLKGGSK